MEKYMEIVKHFIEECEKEPYEEICLKCNGITVKSIKHLLNELDRLQKENEELSYIISEIEQYTLDEQINEESINYNEFIEVQNMAFDGVYNKLQELLNKGEE